MNNKIMKFMVIMAVAICSCSKSADDIIQFKASDFPLKIGNKWVYQVVYNNLSYADTESVTIISKQALSHDSTYYTIQVKTNNSSIVDTQSILTIGGSIIYTSKSEDATPFGYCILELPCSQGDLWKGVSPNDTTKVVSYTPSIQQAGQQFNKVYFFRRKAYSTGFSDLETFKLAAGVGFLEYNVNIYDSGSGIFRNTSSTLISYELH